MGHNDWMPITTEVAPPICWSWIYWSGCSVDPLPQIPKKKGNHTLSCGANNIGFFLCPFAREKQIVKHSKSALRSLRDNVLALFSMSTPNSICINKHFLSFVIAFSVPHLACEHLAWPWETEVQVDSSQLLNISSAQIHPPSPRSSSTGFYRQPPSDLSPSVPCSPCWRGHEMFYFWLHQHVKGIVTLGAGVYHTHGHGSIVVSLSQSRFSPVWSTGTLLMNCRFLSPVCQIYEISDTTCGCAHHSKTQPGSSMPFGHAGHQWRQLRGSAHSHLTLLA